MKEIKKDVVVTEWLKEELPEELREMFRQLEATAAQAYAPYSKFRVACVLRLESGRIVLGNNQENSAYPSGLCAERVALFYAGANYPDEAITHLLVGAWNADQLTRNPACPCGGCLQVMRQSEVRQRRAYDVWLAGQDYFWQVKGTDNLLPFAFSELD